MTKMIDKNSMDLYFNSPEFEVVVLSAAVNVLIINRQELQLGPLPYDQIQDLIASGNSAKEQFDQINARLSDAEATLMAIQKDVSAVKDNMLTKTDMQDAFAEMLSKTVAAINQRIKAKPKSGG